MAFDCGVQVQNHEKVWHFPVYARDSRRLH
jgi:hypothetical protein